MNRNELKLGVGDRVIVSRPASANRFAPCVDQFRTVTAVRPKSFDAGGLCFRNDGREWNGHNRVRLVLSDEAGQVKSLKAPFEEASRVDRASEDATLAFLLTSRNEVDWLKLGLQELRRIAALHGIEARRANPFGAPNVDAQVWKRPGNQDRRQELP
jgi:hypothetical protein